MSSHFDCIGLRAPDGDSFVGLVSALAESAVEDAPGHLRWTDPSGATIALHLGDGMTIDCVTPFFLPADEPLSRWRVRADAPALDPGCEHCGGADFTILDGAGEMVTRATVQLLHFVPFQPWLRETREFDLEVVAFAEWAAFFATAEDFAQGQHEAWGGSHEIQPRAPESESLRLAEQCFLPLGMFAPEGAPMAERARALFSGQVTHVSTLTSSATKETFQRVRVDGLGGPLDVVLDPSGSRADPVPGAIALVRAWLVGRPAIQQGYDSRVSPT